jgi:hypothetical protein
VVKAPVKRDRRVTGRRAWAVLVVVLAVVFASSATAKEFGPHDLKLCGRSGCAPIRGAETLHAFSTFAYGEGRVSVVSAPRVGAPSFAIRRVSDGNLIGVVSGRRLDRFRANGIYCGRFHRGVWYRLPARVTRELRKLTAQLVPAKLSATIPRSC